MKDLVNYLLSQKSAEEMKGALFRLLTPNECIELSNRLKIFQMLEEGVPQRKIADTLGVGIATVTRGSNALKATQEKSSMDKKNER